MPCTMMSDITPGEIAARAMEMKAEKLTQLLCALMRQLEASGFKPADPELARWWDEHKRWDGQQGRP